MSRSRVSENGERWMCGDDKAWAWVQRHTLHALSPMCRRATSVCQPRHDQMEQGPTEPHAGRQTFLLSSAGAGGRYYRVASGTGPIPTGNEFSGRH